MNIDNIYFTSDHHFGHNNVIRYCKRPFKYMDEMHEFMIDSWNSTVKPNNHVFHLGDMFFYKARYRNEILNRLNGYIYLILGNHDDLSYMTDTNRFVWIKHYHYLILKIPNTDQKLRFVLFHYPLLTWQGMYKGSYHIYGHCHGQLNKQYTFGKKIDVGVDTNKKMKPYSLLEVKEILDNKESIYPDKVDIK